MTDERPAKTVDVEAARKLLEDALDGTRPRAEKASKIASLLELKPQIVKLRKQKYSWAKIADLLKSTGVGNKDTIRYAIEGKKGKKRGTAAKSTTSVAAIKSGIGIEPADETKRTDVTVPKKSVVDPADYAKTRL